MSAQASRILVVEDDRFLRKAAEMALRREGYDVVVAADGEEALQKTHETHPDLVLLDVIMPKLQGFEVLSRLKEDPATRAIPVIMMSNLGEDADIRAALKAGAAAYLVKSNVGLVELTAKVGETLSERTKSKVESSN